MNTRSIALALSLSALTFGCGPADTSDEAPVAPAPELIVDGATTTVVNGDIPVWRGPGVLIEEASIGSDVGDEAYLLGGVTSIAASADRIYLVDHQTVSVRAYDMAGTHLFDIGAEGQGPGEFRRPFDVGYTDDGRVLVRDQAQRRLNAFTADGDHIDDWPTFRGNRTTIATDGAVYTLTENIFPDEEGLVTTTVHRVDPRGNQEDPLDFPHRPPPPLIEMTGNQLELMAVFLGLGGDWRSTVWVPFGPRVIAEIGADGAMISGRADTYRFEVVRRDGSTMVVTKDWAPVAVEGAEGDWNYRRLTAQWRAATDESWMWLGGEIPPHKGAYKHIVPTVDGHFWVIREMAGVPQDGCDNDPDDYYGFDENPCWVQPYIADVFDEEGRFLGPVPMPEGIRYHIRPFIRGDAVIALLESAAGVAHVERYRLELPS